MNTKKSTFTFIHIPKTGGTSIRAALEPYQDRHEYKFGKYDYAKGHSPVKPIKHLLSPECITFAVVRNTWSRVVSLYLYNEGKHHDLSSKTKEQRQESFAYWIDNNLLAGKVSLSQQQLYWLIDKDDIQQNMSQYNYSTNATYNTDIIVDHIMKFENLAEDWKKMCEIINIPHKPLTHVLQNTLRQKEKNIVYRDWYTDHTKQCIYKHYKDTIDYFGFEF